MIFMIRILILCLCAFSSLHAQQIPGSEIYLFDLKNGKNEVVLSNPKNITNHPGYDNQPFFHPDKPLLYFTSANEDSRTDIIEYNLKTSVSKKITNTTEREYSPTVTPDKKFISCIIQRDNGAQDLGKYPIEGGVPEVIINSLTVGYHAWLDNNTLYVFVLGEPPTLHRYLVSEKRDEVIESNIGRSIHKVPGSKKISFVHKATPEKWTIKTIEGNATAQEIGETLTAREDLAWTPDGKLIMSNGEKFFIAEPALPLNWKEIKLDSTLKLKGITRLAVSNDGTMVAVVVSE
jgi:hypothetical protein